MRIVVAVALALTACSDPFVPATHVEGTWGGVQYMSTPLPSTCPGEACLHSTRLRIHVDGSWSDSLTFTADYGDGLREHWSHRHGSWTRDGSLVVMSADSVQSERATEPDDVVHLGTLDGHTLTVGPIIYRRLAMPRPAP